MREDFCKTCGLRALCLAGEMEDGTICLCEHCGRAQVMVGLHGSPTVYAMKPLNASVDPRCTVILREEMCTDCLRKEVEKRSK